MFILDYALIRELFDIPVPGPGADQQEMEEYYSYELPEAWTESFPHYSALTGAASFLSDGYTQWGSYYQGHREYLGFDIRNEDQSMVAGVLGRQLEVLHGRFDPEATDRALSSCSGECTPPDTREEYQGVMFYSWGDDYKVDPKKKLAPSAFDHIGRGGRIAVQDSYVFRTLGTDDMKSLLDTSLAESRSLADVDEFLLLARGMSELGAYAMFLTDQTQGFEETLKVLCEGFDLTMSDQFCLRIGAQVEERQPMLRRYNSFATGVGKDEQGAYTALVLVHADDGSASDNVRLLRRRLEDGTSFYDGTTWVEFFDTDSLDISAKGRVLLAKLRPIEGIPPLWIKLVYRRGQLLLHESPGLILPTPGPVAPVTPTAAAVVVPTQPPATVVNLTISVNGDALQFDDVSLTASSGAEVTVSFDNESSINQHNWVLVEAGTKDAVAAAGPGLDWMPFGDPRVIASTHLLSPGESGEVRFTAPAPGTYQFVCTFPGHNVTMFGDFVVIP